MRYQEFGPTAPLKPYIKCFYFFESDNSGEVEDTVFPGGNLEVIFNLGEGIWKTASKGIYHKTPAIELWGQLTRPLPVRSEGKSKMLGVRFSTHGAAFFFKEEIWKFNDRISDALDLFGKSIGQLYERLIHTPQLNARIVLLENFLLNRLFAIENKPSGIDVVRQIVVDLQGAAHTDDIKTLASKYDLTPRYLQKLFLRHTGVTPKLYQKINRFQASLKMVATRDSSLTNIAFDCGYFDQSHFIREFKSFTGIRPSDYTAELFPVSVALSNV